MRGNNEKDSSVERWAWFKLKPEIEVEVKVEFAWWTHDQRTSHDRAAKDLEAQGLLRCRRRNRCGLLSGGIGCQDAMRCTRCRGSWAADRSNLRDGVQESV